MEEKIIKLIRSQDDRGLELLIENYSGLIYYIVSNIVTDREDIEECINDIYMKIWNYINSYSKEKGKLTTWITAISRNSAIDFAKKPHGLHEEVRDDYAHNFSTEAEVVRREDSQALKKAIATLSAEEQHIFYRKYYYLQKTSQISAELGRSERSIEGKLYRIRKKLQKILRRDIHG